MIYLIHKFSIFFTVFSAASTLYKTEINSKNISRDDCNENNLKPVVGVECEHETTCDEVKNYPEIIAEKYINMIIQSESKLPNSTQIVGLHNIVYNSCQDICCHFEKKIIPRAARSSEENEWFFILNSLNSTLYSFRSETCRSPGTLSINKLVKFKDNYRGVCKQEKIHLLLYAFDKIGDTPTLRNVSINSWCSCNVMKLNN